MDYEIFSNERKEANDFSMKYTCSFCDKFNSKVLRLTDTNLLVCSGCLNKMGKALDKAMIDDFI